MPDEETHVFAVVRTDNYAGVDLLGIYGDRQDAREAARTFAEQRSDPAHPVEVMLDSRSHRHVVTYICGGACWEVTRWRLR